MRLSIIVSGVIAVFVIMACSVASAAPDTVTVHNITSCECKGEFFDFKDCKIVSADQTSIQAQQQEDNGALTPFGGAISVGTNGPAPIFQQHGTGYPTIAVRTSKGMPLTLSTSFHPGQDIYVIAFSPMDGFVSYAIDTQSHC